MVDLDQVRKDSLANWERSARNWGKHREFIWSETEALSRRLIERLDPQPGDTVLEVAAGTGETSFLVSESLGDEGRAVLTDFASQMVEEARQAGEARGFENVEYRVLDAERMDLEDSSVDGVISRFGYMLMADPGLALKETRRVLRDGGRLAFAVWAGPDRNPWAAVPAMELISRGHLQPPEPGGPGIFSMADPARIEELVTGAGFARPQIEQFEINWGYADTEAHWTLVKDLAAPLAAALDELDDDEHESVRLAVAEKIDPMIVERGGVPGLCHVVLAS